MEISVALNKYFYDLSQHTPMEYRDFGRHSDSRFAIGRVATDKTKRKKFRRIIEHFPHRADLATRSSYLLRAFSGLQIFPDGNHRTGLAIVRFMIHDEGHDLTLQGDALARFIHSIRSQKSRYWARCRTNELAGRDEVFHHIHQTLAAHLVRRGLGIRMARRSSYHSWAVRT